MKILMLIPFSIMALMLLASVGCSKGEQDQTEAASRYVKSATVYEKQGQLRAAMLEARNAIQSQPQQPGGYLVLAKIYNKIGAFGATQSLLEPMKGKFASLDLLLAEAYMANKKFQSAEGLLTSIVDADLSDEQWLEKHRIQAQTHLYTKDYQDFAKVLAKVEAAPSGQPLAQYLRAAEALTQSNTAAAQEYLNALVAVEPNNFDALILLGDIALAANQLDSAEKFFTRALSTQSNTDILLAEKSFVLRRLTDTLISLGRSAEAFTYQKILSEENPGAFEAQQKFESAMKLFLEGQLEEAAVLLTALQNEYPQDKSSGTLLGVVAQRQGRNTLAAELFDSYIDTETASPSVIQAAALAKIRTEKAEEALVMLRDAVDSQPNNASILATYGLALIELGKPGNEGILAVEKSLAMDASQHRLRLALAKHLQSEGKTEQALAQLQKAYSEAPQDFLVQQVYYKALLATAKRDALNKEIASFRSRFPDDSRADFFSGWLAIVDKRYKEAERFFEQAVAKGGYGRELALTGLAQTFELQGNLVKAATTWQATVEENPTIMSSYANWLSALRKQGKLDQAYVLLQELEKEPKLWQPSAVLAQLALDQQDIATAESKALAALAKNPNSNQLKLLAANIYQRKGFILYAGKDINNARAALLKSVELVPENVTFIANLIKVELDQNDLVQAQKILDQYAENPNNKGARAYLQGKIHERSGAADKAFAMYQQAWNTQPNDLTGEVLFRHWQRGGDNRKAKQFLDDWAEKMPKSSSPLLYQAMAAQQQTNTVVAEKLYRKALELNPELPVAWNNLAWIYYDRKDDRALEMAEKAFLSAPQVPAIMDTYGWFLVEKGEVERGNKILEQAVALAPENDEIKAHWEASKAK